MVNSSYSNLIQKLDLFIRKYYVNQLFRGSLYFIGLVVAYFLVISVLEGSFYFDKSVRKVLFYSLLGIGGFAAYTWIIQPLIKIFKLGKTISHEQAALIIGDHFYDVKDKLLNILQLNKQYEHGNASDLVLASISQKTESIKFVPFQKAIDLSKNRQYLKYALPPVLCLVGLLFMSPSLITKSSYRLFNNNEDFEKEAPFRFDVVNEDLKAMQFQDFTLKVKIEGNVLPAEAFLDVDGFTYKLEKLSSDEYEYTFRNVQKNVAFTLTAGEVSSIPLELEVLPKPNITNFETQLNYPAYVGRKNERFTNTGDLIIPEGTTITWNFNTTNTEKISMLVGDAKELKSVQAVGEGAFSQKLRAMDNFQYTVYLENQFMSTPDSLSYTVSVIKDQYPSIAVEPIVDSLDNSTILFVGDVSDDYGINRLTFNYSITDEKGKITANEIKKVTTEDGRAASFRHLLYIKDLELKPGDKLQYFFEVFDNDGVHGSKSSKSGVMTYLKPTLEQLQAQEDENEEAIKDNLKDAQKNIDKMAERFQKMKEKLLQKKQLDWQDKKELEKILEQQKELQEQLQKANEKMKENLQNQEELQKPDEEIQEKQEKLEEMMEDAANEENKELIEKIQELMQELEKEDALKMMDEFKMQNENLEKKTDRLLELFKQLEMEKEVKEQIEKLNELGDKQEKLAEQTEQKEDAKSKEELAKEQEKLNKEFDEVKKELEKLEEKNKELSPPKDMGKDNEEKMEDIDKDMDKASDQLKKENKEGAAKAQKSAGKKMKAMAGEMEQNMESGDAEQHQEDVKTIRQILENLVTLSFDQEELVGGFRETPVNTPKFVDLVKEQFKIKDEFQIIEDSLTELSKRVEEVSSFIGEKVTEVKYNMNNSIELLEDRVVNQAQEKQRRTMTNLNDLALMLSESMKNMQQQMAGSMPGNQNCAKPGGSGKSGKNAGNVPMDKISEGQQGMDESLQGIQKKMGKEGKEGPEAKDFAQAAARQAALRKALQDLKKEKQEQGKGAGELQGIIDQMDKIETDLVNRRLNAETLKRQKDIVTRLLEAEKAERQRGEDEKRKSEQGVDVKQELPPAIQDYLKKREAEVELYKTVSPALKPYYRMLVDEYYKELKRN